MKKRELGQEDPHGAVAGLEPRLEGGLVEPAQDLGEAERGLRSGGRMQARKRTELLREGRTLLGEQLAVACSVHATHPRASRHRVAAPVNHHDVAARVEPSVSCKKWCARESRDFTVPSEIPSTSAISS